jgi:hypothetical protein
MITVRFVYQNDDYDLSREIIITKLCIAVSNVISLPNEIIIRIAWLGESVHGNTAVEHRFKNRVSINSILSLNEIPIVLIHELIHVNQIHTGLLSVSRHGVYTWNNKQYTIPESMSMECYLQLPWEADVVEKHQKVLTDSLAYAMKNS